MQSVKDWLAWVGLLVSGIGVEFAVALADANRVPVSGMGPIGPIALWGGWILIAIGLFGALATSANMAHRRLQTASFLSHRAPRLAFSPRRADDLQVHPSTDRADFVLIRVTNEADRPQGDATDVWGVLNWHGPSGQRLSITARCATSPYPPDGHEERTSIPAGQHRDFDVACRFHGESNAYLVNTEGFVRFGARNPEARLAPGDHTAEIRINHSTGSHRQKFTLRNPKDGPLEIVTRPDIRSAAPSAPTEVFAHAGLAEGFGVALSPSIEISNALAAQITRAPSIPGTNEVNWTTEGKRSRHIPLDFQPRTLRFFAPVDVTVSTVPSQAIPVDSGHVMVTRFFDKGFMVDEVGTVGDVVRVEPYPEEPSR